jgi:hypothetical protein
MRRFSIVFMMITACICAHAQMQCVDVPRVRAAVGEMTARYPQSTLQDIYKSFFQDRFGPGHMVPDSAYAAAALKRELEKVGETGCLLYEPTGDMGNYYRVSLAVVVSGKVPFNVYLSAFLRSVRDVPPVDVVAWEKEWAAIEGVIRAMALPLPGFEDDSAAIKELLSSGYYAVHHSEEYNKEYDPHYRIISKEIFEKEILPLIIE